MSIRNKITVATIFLSYVLLYPGLTRDMLTISASMTTIQVTWASGRCRRKSLTAGKV